MAHCRAALQAFHDGGFGECIADQPDTAFSVKSFAVEGNDTACLLAAVLQGMQPKGCQGCCVFVAEYTEHAAFLAQAVAIHVELVGQSVLSVRHLALPLFVPGCRLCHLLLALRAFNNLVESIALIGLIAGIAFAARAATGLTARARCT